jgi:hypothetical protein
MPRGAVASKSHELYYMLGCPEDVQN